MKAVKEIVKIRSRKVANGESLYLDIILNGQRKRENLNLYLQNGTSRQIKAQNKETMAMAEAVKAQRTLEIQNGRFGLVNKEGGKILILDWLESQRKHYYDKGSVSYSYTLKNVIGHISAFLNDKKATLNDINKKFILDFIKYLNKVRNYNNEYLGNQTIYTYYVAFIIAINKAVKDDLIPFNPADKIPAEEKPRRTPTRREYLTLDEVQLMIDTECKDVRVKRLFLFCCFTGLRYSDAFLLKWKNLIKQEDGTFQIEIVQKKTKELVYIPLNENALRFLPDKYMDGPENRIFPMPETSCAYDYLHEWAEKAGIKKNVTFHVARHTYATLLLNYGADIYTVSKLLGHTSVKTTQIYAKIMDETKRKAVDLIPKVKLS